MVCLRSSTIKGHSKIHRETVSCVSTICLKQCKTCPSHTVNQVADQLDLITIALYIQNATNEMHPCSLSITYTFPYCNPPPPWVRRSTMFSAHQSSSQQPSYLTSALYNENRDLSVKRTSLQSGRHHMQSGQDREWEHKHADKLLWDFLWQFVQNLFGYANQLWQQLSRWLVSDNLRYEGAECWGHGLVYLHVACLLGIWLFLVCFFLFSSSFHYFVSSCWP